MSHFVSEPDFPTEKPGSIRCGGGVYDIIKKVDKFTVGVLFRLTSAWIGVHYSKTNRRACVNLVPFVTIWIARKGGRRP